MDIIKQINEYLPTYTTVLPFSKKEVTFNPFRVKDLKHISIVLQENNKKLAFMSMVEILKNNSKLSEKEILSLCIADAEYLFLQIRGKSVEENLNLVYNNEKIKVNISQIEYKNKIQKETFSISDGIKIVLKTPNLKDLLELESFEKENLINSCIENIVIKNEIYEKNKFIPAEIKTILEDLPLKFINDADIFLKNEPSLFVNLKTETGTKEVSGILNFFIFR